MPRDAGHRRQRVLPRLSGREPSRVASDAWPQRTLSAAPKSVAVGRPPTLLRNLWKLRRDPEASHLLRPTAGHRDLSRPQPRRLLVGHIHDGEATEVLLGLDERTVGEQRRALDASTLNTGAASSRPPVKMKTPAAFISATNALTALDFSRSSSIVWSGTHSSLKAMRYSVMSPPLLG